MTLFITSLLFVMAMIRYSQSLPTHHNPDLERSFYLQSFDEEYSRYPVSDDTNHVESMFFTSQDEYNCDNTEYPPPEHFNGDSNDPKVILTSAMMQSQGQASRPVYQSLPYQGPSTSGSDEKPKRIYKGEKKQRAQKQKDFDEQYEKMGLNSNLSPERLADLAEFINVQFDASTSLIRMLRRRIAPEVNDEYLRAFDRRRKMITNDKYAMYNKTEKFQADPGSMTLMRQTIDYLVQSGRLNLNLEEIGSIENLEEKTRGLWIPPYSISDCTDAIQMFLAFQVGPDYGSYFRRLRRDSQG